MSSESQTVDERCILEPTATSIDAEHRREQASGAVFEGRRYGRR
jgi:hypothetical protein